VSAVQQREPLVLASGSPRRREILSQLGLSFTVIESGVDEPPPGAAEPAAYATGLAEKKAAAVVRRLRSDGQRAFVLAADTIVVVGLEVLNKPEGDEDAVSMLLALQGRGHEVITAVALRHTTAETARVLAVRTQVTFRAFDEATARRYVASGEGRDKAGSYAAQGLGAGLIEALNGSYSNVVGLPASETLVMLQGAGAAGAWP
jgi:septum formation protein